MRRSEFILVDDRLEIERGEFVSHPDFEFSVSIPVAVLGAKIGDRVMQIVQGVVALATKDDSRAVREPAEVMLVFEEDSPLEWEYPAIQSALNSLTTACTPLRRGLSHGRKLAQNRQERLGGVADVT